MTRKACVLDHAVYLYLYIERRWQDDRYFNRAMNLTLITVVVPCQLAKSTKQRCTVV